MSQLGPEPSPELDAMIADLMRMSTIALAQRKSGGEPTPGWGSVHIEDLVISGLPPDDVEIRIDDKTTNMRMVYANVYGGTSVGTKASMERALKVLQTHLILEELSEI